jgi:choline dehydrogenase-like flavoprotein
MHIDARSIPDQSLIEADICIIGAGPAGISMALDWNNSRHSVVLLEGGGFKVDNRMQELYRGESIGQKYYALQAARLHYFGGTSGHWGGLCTPLDPIDFRHRSWVPESGWPIKLNDLEPYYAQAQKNLELPGYSFDLPAWQKRDPSLKAMPLDAKSIVHKIWQFSPPTRFGSRYRSDIEKSPNIRLYTHANVVGIDANEEVSRIEQVSIKNFEGKTHTVRARYFVLACGAIENARLLLNSNQRASHGIGNENDCVGRYFMEHLEVNSGDLIMPKQGPMKLYLLDFYLTKVRAEFTVSEKKQEEAGILNGSVSLMAKSEHGDDKANIDWFDDNAENNVKMWEDLDRSNVSRAGEFSLRNSIQQLRKMFAPLRGMLQGAPPTFELFTRLEQSPNAASRIFLNNDKDEFGMQRVTLDWKISGLEKRSIRKIIEILGQEIGRAGLGRIKIMDWLQDEKDLSWPSILGGGWHHMGTTRMHEDPKKGVVDINCKIHGVDNLYVAGSSCFSTSGAASPTMNLIALSLRLSDHLKTKMMNDIPLWKIAASPGTIQ